MHPIIPIIIIVIIVTFIFFLITPSKHQKGVISALKEYLTTNNIEFELTESNNKLYNYNLKVNNKTYLLKLVNLPSHSEVQINNFNTWEVKYGAGDTPGKPQPYKRYLNELRPFLSYQTKDNEQRLIILTPKAKKIVKYINECEIVFVKSETGVYGSKVINEYDYKWIVLENQKQNEKVINE